MPEEEKIDEAIVSLVNQSALKIEHSTSVESVDRVEWDDLLGDRGTFDWNGLKFLEDSFSGNKKAENNWTFDYIVIRDHSGKPILATFLTSCLNKDDMIAPQEVSHQIEQMRVEDPYYLTSYTLFMGSMLTEGDHLFINKEEPSHKESMSLSSSKSRNTTLLAL